ncbi:MAG: HepT-like ribonuclease domain-containing protein [Glycocaulis sp.]
MPERGKSHDWKVLVADMIEHAGYARFHVKDMDRDGFCADLKTVHAVTRCVEVIGEAVRHVPADIRQQAPGIPWGQIVGTRHILAHHYGRVDPVLLWNLVTARLEPLETELQALLAAAP